MAAHLSALIAVAGLPFGHVIGPLIVYLIKAHESEFVAEHAKASLNYQITVSIAGFVGLFAAFGVMLGFIATQAGYDSGRHGIAVGFVAFWIVAGAAILLILLCSLIFIIVATIAANEGRYYTYPFAIRFLR